tara:strand:+ start:450 stop:584 length:135 start_codon:yes stop_codon:yes gene_type:complete
MDGSIDPDNTTTIGASVLQTIMIQRQIIRAEAATMQKFKACIIN